MKNFKQPAALLALLCLVSSPLSAQDLSTKLSSESELQIGDILPNQITQNPTLQMDFSKLEQNSFMLEISFTPEGAEFDPILATISDNEAFVTPSKDAIAAMEQAFGGKSTDPIDFDYGDQMQCMGNSKELLSMCILNGMLISLQSDKLTDTQNTYYTIKKLMLDFQSTMSVQKAD